MPTYEYVCKNCGHRFDVVQSMQDESLTVCPNCGEPQLRKVFAPPAISFKGSGFYATDHGGKAKPRRDGANEKGDERQSGAAAKDGGSKGGKESGSGDSSSGGSSSSDSSSSDSSSKDSTSSGSSSRESSSREPSSRDSSSDTPSKGGSS